MEPMLENVQVQLSGFQPEFCKQRVNWNTQMAVMLGSFVFVSIIIFAGVDARYETESGLVPDPRPIAFFDDATALLLLHNRAKQSSILFEFPRSQTVGLDWF